MKQSLGLIEVRGLALAVNVADAMAKSAAIQLVGVEKTNGGGWTVIKIIGDVAAVKSALNTGAALAEQFAGLVSQTALARPDDHVLRMTVPAAVVTPAASAPVVEPVVEPLAELPGATALAVVAAAPVVVQAPAGVEAPAEVEAPAREETPAEVEVNAAPAPVIAAPVTDTDGGEEAEVEEDAADSTPGGQTASCNLCHDPLCPRQKGEPRHKCLHIRG